jgi:four helix bundle protein
MQDFQNLKVWSKAHQLTLSLYRCTRDFPPDERFGLVSQIRRAGASIGANIAEGCGRRGNAELVRFLHIAMGSASEAQYHILLARDLSFLKPEQYVDLHSQVTDVKRMLAALAAHLRSDKPMN